MGQHVRLVGLAAIALGACTASHFEGPDLSPGVGNSAGQGDGTLYVDAKVNATPMVMNTTDARLFDVKFRVFVKSTVGGDVSGSVTISSDTEVIPLAFDGATWVGTISGYEQVYQLDIDDDAGFVHRARVEGPDVHRITTPLAGSTVHQTHDLVEWQRGIPAAEVTITGASLGEYLEISEDLGRSESNALGGTEEPTDTLTVMRTNQVEPANTGTFNGAPSQFSVSVSNSIEVIKVP